MRRGDNTGTQRNPSLGTFETHWATEMRDFDSLSPELRYLYNYNPVLLSAGELLAARAQGADTSPHRVALLMNRANSLELDTSRVSRKRDIPSYLDYITLTSAPIRTPVRTRTTRRPR